MTVWIVFCQLVNEGDTVVSAHATEESAQKEARRQRAEIGEGKGLERRDWWVTDFDVED